MYILYIEREIAWTHQSHVRLYQELGVHPKNHVILVIKVTSCDESNCSSSKDRNLHRDGEGWLAVLSWEYQGQQTVFVLNHIETHGFEDSPFQETQYIYIYIYITNKNLNWIGEDSEIVCSVHAMDLRRGTMLTFLDRYLQRSSDDFARFQVAEGIAIHGLRLKKENNPWNCPHFRHMGFHGFQFETNLQCRDFHVCSNVIIQFISIYMMLTHVHMGI